MKKSRSVLYGLLPLLFLLVSCQTLEPVKMNPDYVAGRHLAEKYAKKDAQELHCPFYRRKAWQNIMSGKLREHTEDLKSEKTKDFLNGFVEGYRKYYAEYADTYCGE
jgi:hypothetical protein